MFVFYHEFDTMSSGAAVTIVNLIKGLVQQKQEVLFFAKKDGVLHSSLKNCNPAFLQVINNDKASVFKNRHLVKETDTIITVHYYSIYKYFKKNNPKILFYCVNITSLSIANEYFNKINIKFLTKRLFRYISRFGGLVFIDEYSVQENQKAIGVAADKPAFLPIPVEVPAKNLWMLGNRKNRILSFTYVGRAVDWKIFPIRKLLKDITELIFSLKEEINLHIITDDQKIFQEYIADFKIPAVNIFFYENLSQEELAKLLLEKSDIHFGMGTASLDGAKLGIPTIVLDFSFEEFPETYLYNFLYTTKGNTVGSWIKKGEKFEGFTLKELVDFTYEQSKMNELSQLSYNYVLDNHELSDITNKLVNFSFDCKAHIKDISKYLVRYWFN